MTVIVGLRHELNGRRVVTLAADSQSSTTHVKRTRRPKVFKVHDQLVLAVAGSVRVGQLLAWRLKRKPYTGSHPRRWVYTTFVDEVRKVLKKHGSQERDRDVERVASHSGVMIGFRDRLYLLHGDYSISELRFGDYDSVGTGQEVALGAMYATEDLEPLHRLETACEAAIEHARGCGLPVTMETTRGRKA